MGFGDGVAVAIVGEGPQVGGRVGLVKSLPLRAEVVDETTAATLGWRSMRSTIDIDCDHRKDLVLSMEVFAEHDLKGASSKPKLPGTWGQPDRLAYLGGVISAVCRGGYVTAEAPTRAWSEAVVAPPSSPARLPPARRGHPPVTATRPEPVAAVRPASSAAADGPVVQIAAGGSEEGARRALAQLQAPSLAGLNRFVQTATKDGKPLYRAVIGGFASKAAAVAFCAALEKSGRTCLVR